MRLTKQDYLRLYRNLVRARAYDVMFARRLRGGKLLAFYHQAEGGEAPGVGSCTFLRQDDFLYPHYRGHAVPHMLSKGIDPKAYLAEHCGKANGMSNGLSAFHPCAPEFGVYGWCGAVGFQFHVSVGFGMAAKRNRRGQVVMSNFGDGATNRGLMHEAFLMATRWELPIIWVCENNGLAMFVPYEDVYKAEHIADLAKGYGMPAEVVDGQDVIAVAKAAIKAIERARSGGGPSFIECKTTRFNEHDIGTPDLVGTRKRTPEEIETLRQRDPVKICRDKLLKSRVLTQKLIQQIDREVAAEIEEAERFADAGPLPEPSVLETALYAD